MKKAEESFKLMHKGADGEHVTSQQWRQAFQHDGITGRSARKCTIYTMASRIPFANANVVEVGQSCLPPGGK